MSLSPKTLSLLDDLCFARANHCRVKELHRFGLMIRMHELRKFGLIESEGYEPSAGVMDLWRAKQPQLVTVDEVREGMGEKAPEPEVPADGDGVARKAEAPSPNFDFQRLLDCFGDEFETLRVIAARFGASSPQKIVRHARTLHESGLVEQQPPVNGQPFCLWRRTQRDNRGAVQVANGEGPEPCRRPVHPSEPRSSREQQTPDAAAPTSYPGAPGTPREGPGASSSGDALRIEDRAPPEEPAPRICPPASARPVDIKVNIGARRDPTQRPDGYGEQDGSPGPASSWRADAQSRMRKAAEKKLDAGETPGEQSSVALKIAMREVERDRELQRRLADPLEQAKSKLQRRYQPVCSMAVYGGRADRYVVGSKRDLTEAQLLEMAERLAA